MKIGDRVVLLVDYDGLQPGEEGTVVWEHPRADYPWRVKFDNDKWTFNIGMSDIGWLVTENEVELIDPNK